MAAEAEFPKQSSIGKLPSLRRPSLAKLFVHCQFLGSLRRRCCLLSVLSCQSGCHTERCPTRPDPTRPTLPFLDSCKVSYRCLLKLFESLSLLSCRMREFGEEGICRGPSFPKQFFRQKCEGSYRHSCYWLLSL